MGGDNSEGVLSNDGVLHGFQRIAPISFSAWCFSEGVLED